MSKIDKRPDHLQNVKLGDETYDLTTQQGRKEFDKAVDKLERDGLDVDYNRRTNELEVNGQRYDLDRRGDFREFRRDARDGLDGSVTPQHLRDVNINGEQFNLATDAGRKKFEADLADGKIDGKADKPVMDVWIDPITKTVYAGDVEYDLKNKRDFHNFRRDAGDGVVDGHRGARPAPGAPPAATPPATTPPATTPPAAPPPPTSSAAPPPPPPPTTAAPPPAPPPTTPPDPPPTGNEESPPTTVNFSDNGNAGPEAPSDPQPPEPEGTGKTTKYDNLPDSSNSND